VLRLVAHHGPIPTIPVLPLSRGTLPGRSALERRTIHVADLQVETEEDPEFRDRARRLGFHTMLGVPLMRAGETIGVIAIRRIEVRPFTDRQIDLLKTFSDQAVIAIENARLFEAEQASKRELQESLEYQTAISDVLNVISRSPNRLQPVFEVIAQNASRLCGGEYAIVTRYDGSLIQLVAQHNPRPGAAEETARLYPLPADPKASPTSRAIVTGSMVHMPDVENEELMDSTLATFRRISARAISIAAGARSGHFAVSVTDTGPGIPLDQQGRIFDQFHQVDSSNTKAKGGTGLGLAIAKQIVEMHGGRIWVESTLGKGSAFQMELPTRAELRKPLS
jgi:two-component system, NtrC family, sensor kinase